MSEHLYKLLWWLGELMIALTIGVMVLTLALVVAIVSLPVAFLATLLPSEQHPAGIRSFYQKQIDFWISLCRDVIP